MKRLTIGLVGMTVALFSNVCFGQERGGIPEEIIKELDGLVGTWTVEGRIGDKEQTGRFTIRWARAEDRKKCCLIGRGSFETDGKKKSAVSLLGWNAAKQCIEDRGFDANGGNGVNYWTVESPGKWAGEVIVVEGGKEIKSKAVLVKKGPSEVVMESESETGEVARWIFRKVSEGKKE